jgi:hypothetical protein
MKLKGPVAALVVGACIATSSVATAQDAEDDASAQFGGLGKAYVGGYLADWGAPQDTLRPLFGDATRIGQANLMAGGGGFLTIGGFVIAGGGHAILVSTSDGDAGELDMIGGGGGLALGYALVRSRDWFIYPYVGGAGYGFTLTLNNTSSEAIEVGRHRLDPGDTIDLVTGFAAMDFGVSIQQLLFFGDGGFSLGLDVGGLVSLTGGDWSDGNGEPVSSVGSARMRGAYFRLTVGGGGFDFSD